MPRWARFRSPRCPLLAGRLGWYSPALSAPTDYTLEVTVSDGTESVTRSVSVKATIPSYYDHIQPIFDAACISCHKGTRQPVLLKTDSYAAIVGKMPTDGNPRGTPLNFVQPGNPDDSLRIRKISGTSCGSRMPKNDPTFFNPDRNPGYLNPLRSWILAGASEN